MNHSPAPASAFFCVRLLIVALVMSGEVSASDAEIEFFEAKIRPVLVEKCYSCHSGDSSKIKGGLRLDSREAMRAGGDSGAAVVPHKPDDSLLLQAIRYEGLEMPPDGRLSAEIVSDFEKWIGMGAADPRDGLPAATERNEIDWNTARQFWSFVPPSRHAPRTTAGNAASAIDSFVIESLSKQQLSANPPADRRTLIRRVTFDLIGLPPTAEEVSDFIQDESPLAYERLVERLLASPQHGERWSRMWLDLARYAEDQAHIVGNDQSLCYPNAYRYRDWLIAAMNADLPYDEFIRRQLAADLLNPAALDEHVALGFIGLGPKYYRRNAPEVMADEWEDRVDVIGRGLLGLTVACSRCHDHKYDPIPTADYYALAGVFASTEMYNRPLTENVESEKNGQAKKPDESLHVVRDLAPKDLNIQIRGDHKNLGPVVPRAFLTVLSPDRPTAFTHGSGRLDLAEAIVSRSNPLTARVIVNRVWGQLIGKPLVATPSNFGKLGELATHPELLDDLAIRFMDSGWSLKWLQREIVLSATYRQSSKIDLVKQTIDPANRWLWRMNRRRLSIEAWRDALLTASGRLANEIGGPSIEPQDTSARRRTVYSRISRLELDKVLAMFDFPDPNVHSEWRSETTTPLQKLFVLNSPFMLQQAESLSGLIVQASADDGSRLDFAYRQLFQRGLTQNERQVGLDFLMSCGEMDEQERWTQFAQALLASNEMSILD